MKAYPLKFVITIFIAALCWGQAAYDSNSASGGIRHVPGLPRVLLIGDSISMGYTLPVGARLAGIASVHRIPVNGGSTVKGKRNLDSWLGNGHWGVIHFNFGLHDCFMENGKHAVPLAEYEANLRDIVARLRLTGARLVWASTTPIPNGVLLRPRDKPPVHDFYEKDIIAYNAVAKRIMDENGVSIDDLYSFALPRLKQIQKAGDIHFTPEGYQALAEQVTGAILRELGQVRKDYGVIVVGGTSAGVGAAISAGRQRMHVADIEENPTPGGMLPNVLSNTDLRSPADRAASSRSSGCAARNITSGILRMIQSRRPCVSTIWGAIVRDSPHQDAVAYVLARGSSGSRLNQYNHG